MKLVLEHNPFSWFGSYKINDDSGKTVFTIEGEADLGRYLEIYNEHGDSVATLIQKIPSILPKYEIYIGKDYVGNIVKKFSLFTPKLSIDFNNWNVFGDFWQWDYQIFSDKKIIATVSEELALVDTYTIDIPNPNDVLPVLLVVLAIDISESASTTLVSIIKDFIC